MFYSRAEILVMIILVCAITVILAMLFGCQVPLR